MSTGIDEAAVAGRLGSDRTATLQAIEEAIELPAPFTFTLAGEASTITLRFGNTSTTPLRIGVRVSGPSRLAFPNPTPNGCSLPGAITDVTIPIEAQVERHVGGHGRSAHAIGIVDRRADRAHRPCERVERPRSTVDGRRALGAGDVVVQPLPPDAAESAARQPPSRNGHPSNGAIERRTGAGERVGSTDSDPASGSADRSSPNGDDVVTRRGRGVDLTRPDRGIGSPPRDRPHRDRQCV